MQVANPNKTKNKLEEKKRKEQQKTKEERKKTNPLNLKPRLNNVRAHRWTPSGRRGDKEVSGHGRRAPKQRLCPMSQPTREM